MAGQGMCDMKSSEAGKPVDLHEDLSKLSCQGNLSQPVASLDILELVQKKEAYFGRFFSDGKRHILPLAILSHLKQCVEENPDTVIDQLNRSTECTSEIEEEFLTEFAFPELNLETVSASCTSSDKRSKSQRKSKRKRQRNISSSEENTETLLGGNTMAFHPQYYSSQDVRSMDVFFSRKTSGKRRWQKTSESSDGSNSSFQHRSRPNYFVAVQVSDPQISDVAKTIQKGIQDAASVDYDKAFIDPVKFHITLMVMNLANNEEIKRAAQSLDQCVPTIASLLSGQPLNLEFKGLSVFGGGRVLYARLEESEGFVHLHQIADEVSKQMGTNGIFSTDSRDWNPHMTLMKFQGDKRLLNQGIKRVDSKLYEPYMNAVFGRQVVYSLQLCHMNKKREDGYYFVEHEAVFAPES